MFSKLLLTALIVLPIASANAQQQLQFSKKASSCRAREIERYYCPDFSRWWQGPYFDNGCSVKCAPGQKARCEEARCDDNQSGRPIPSRCSCK